MNHTYCHEPRCGSASKRVLRKRHSNRRTSKTRIVGESISQLFKVGNMDLNPTEEKILNKGLSFIPTPVGPIKESNIDDFKRRVRLKEYFLNLPKSKTHPFKEKSDFDPGPSTNRALEKYLDAVEEEWNTIRRNPEKIKTNMTVEERKAIKNLKSMQYTVVIKKADKGSTITIAQVERYLADVKAHLTDKTAYRKLDRDHTTEIANRVRQFILQIHQMGYIDRTELLFLMPPNPPQFR